MYFYNAAQGLGSEDGSLIFFNENAEVIDCINASDFKVSKNLQSAPRFYHAFVDSAGTVIASMKTTDNGERPYDNNWRWVFWDQFFNTKASFPELGYSGFEDATGSPVFHSDSLVWPTDLIFMKGTTYVLLLLSQRRRVDVSTAFPKSPVEVAEIVDIGLRVVDRRTRAVVAELSGFDFFTTTSSNWPGYLSSEVRSQLRTQNLAAIPIGHISAIKEVPGGHWSNSLLGKRTFLICHQLLQTIDLITWDFEENKAPTFIWRLPGPNAPKAIRDEWRPRWAFEFDPLEGFSGPLDVTVKNLIPRHILVHEDGRSHRFDRGDGEGCPMSRVVEYHIDLNIDGHGTNRAELVFSYPRILDYPPILNPREQDIKYGAKLREVCKEFWGNFMYQEQSGSVSRTKRDTTIIAQHSDGEIFQEDGLMPHAQVLIEVNRGAEIVARWNATGFDTSLGAAHGGASRIQYLEVKEFRNGEFMTDSADTLGLEEASVVSGVESGSISRQQWCWVTPTVASLWLLLVLA